MNIGTVASGMSCDASTVACALESQYLLCFFVLEVVSATLAKRTAFEALLASQQRGEVCLPVENGGEWDWTEMKSTDACSRTSSMRRLRA